MSTATIATIKREQTGADEARAYRQTIDDVLAALGTDALRGLSEAEARARLERYGKNELTAEKPVPAWRKFLAQFQNVLVILLLVATAAFLPNTSRSRCPTLHIRLFWILMSAGMLLWLAYQGMWNYFEVFKRQEVPDPFL